MEKRDLKPIIITNYENVNLMDLLETIKTMKNISKEYKGMELIDREDTDLISIQNLQYMERLKLEKEIDADKYNGNDYYFEVNSFLDFDILEYLCYDAKKKSKNNEEIVFIIDVKNIKDKIIKDLAVSKVCSDVLENATNEKATVIILDKNIKEYPKYFLDNCNILDANNINYDKQKVLIKN